MPFHWLIFLTCPFMGAPERSDSRYPFTKHKRYQGKQEYFPVFFGISWNCANACMLQNFRNSSRNTTGFDYRHLSRASSRRVHAFPLQLHIPLHYWFQSPHVQVMKVQVQPCGVSAAPSPCPHTRSTWQNIPQALSAPSMQDLHGVDIILLTML